MNIKWIVLAAATACGLAAQTRLTAQIPFPFEIQGRLLAAGSYEISRTAVPDRIVVRNMDTRVALSIVSGGQDRNAQTRNGLVFQKSGDTYFLQSIEVAETSAAYKVPRSRKQMESARQRAAETVYIAAR